MKSKKYFFPAIVLLAVIMNALQSCIGSKNTLVNETVVSDVPSTVSYLAGVTSGGVVENNTLEGIDGTVTYKLTVPQEVKQILSTSQREIRRRDGGMDVLKFHYPDVQFTFGKFRSEPNAVFTLLQVMLDCNPLEIIKLC